MAFEEIADGWQTSIDYVAWTPKLKEKIETLFEIVPFAMEIKLLEDQNWNEIWEASFKEILIDDFCQIRAPFHPHREDVSYSIMIDPRMAFGTGHHETTRLVIRALRDLSVRDKMVVDFGAGTGILAILASLMGASQIRAIENDPVALDNLEENVQLNDATRIHCGLASNLNDFDSNSVDILLANITRDVLSAELSDIFRILKDNGVIVLSGFLHVDLEIMESAIKRINGRLTSVIEENSWIAITAKKIHK